MFQVDGERMLPTELSAYLGLDQEVAPALALAVGSGIEFLVDQFVLVGSR